MDKIIIFTDGAAKGNPGPGGYGAVISLENSVLEIGGALPLTTNNETELKAVVEALKALPKDAEKVEIYTDSKYVVEGATGWTFGWMKNGWKTKSGSDVLHKELWQELISLLKKVPVEWHKIPGHSGLIGNERADTIASDFGDKKSVTLFNGPKSEYSYQIEDVSFDEEKAALRSDARKRQATKAYSYISEVDGVVQTHPTWKECEARVKGKKARFKKSISAEEEQNIISEFTKK